MNLNQCQYVNPSRKTTLRMCQSRGKEIITKKAVVVLVAMLHESCFIRN